ncbi:GAF and ANTAR domain-containing protein [Mumia zhuanghuii]|uniref:GAF and ANTAR domain-containing protein n=1 Tax=Mumia zhuanghuii TaxID=2585211 RepID=A0A5C4MKV4_9ACTN|nr:GAF and ANTAR domain-containing protein [Mumia zhuanghuii]TNC36443.1 GAF and ANTAR domain-containing protein [Mumia zhuanghuii]TNC42404.1 GAF and ANTAR domain-containing protein [Mumia zhuanghuii]
MRTSGALSGRFPTDLDVKQGGGGPDMDGRARRCLDGHDLRRPRNPGHSAVVRLHVPEINAVIPVERWEFLAWRVGVPSGHEGGGMNAGPLKVAQALTDAACAIDQPRTLEATLDAIVEAARATVPGFDHVGISVTHRGGRIETLAGTGQIVWDLDTLQYDLGQGPCVDAIREFPVVAVEHAADDPRWPDYMPAAVKSGVRAQLGVRLFNDEDTLGGLNLYSLGSETIDPGAAELAALFASHATIALGRARQEENLNEALVTRKVIGQAIGIVSERYKISEDQAFHFLVRASSTSNTKLRGVAQQIVDTTNRDYEQGRDAGE